MNRRHICPALSALLALSMACSLLPTEIGRISRDPAKYEGKEVTIRGTVSGRTEIPFFKQAFFVLDDGTGTITVATERGLPRDGEKVTVRGTVRSALRVAGRSYGLVVEEAPR